MLGFSLSVGIANRFGAWWGCWRLVLDFAAGHYHPKGATSLALTETRASSALVLQGDGTYVERAAGELAIGQGVGGQFSQAVTNLAGATSRMVAGINTNTTSPVAYTGDTLFGDTNARVHTTNGICQTNTTIPEEAGVVMFARHYKKIAPGAQLLISEMGVGGIDQFSCRYDFDSGTTLNGRAPHHIQKMADGWLRFIWRAVNSGAGTLAIMQESVTDAATRGYVSDKTDIWQGDFIVNPIVDMGAGATCAADHPIVVQGLGDETMVDAQSPADWDAMNATLTPNGDGAANIASTGELSHRSGSSSKPWKAGVLQRGFFEFEAGTSGAGRIVLCNMDSANVYAQAAGYVGALAVTHDTGCTVAITGQTESNGVHRLDYDFTPDFDVANTQIAFGPNTDVSGNGVKLNRGGLNVVLPYPGYCPDSQAYAETEIQHALNPILDGPVGAVAPTGYARVGSEDSSTILPAETIGGILCNPVSLRMGASLGYQGIGHSGGLKVGTHKVLCYIRRPAGLSGERFAIRLPGGGAPSVNVLLTAAEVDTFPDDVWVRQAFDITVTAEGSTTEFILPGGVAGQGFDLALPNIILDTAQDVETQPKQGAFSRLLAGDGFASTVFPSAKDLVAGGGFDTQEDVDLWAAQAATLLSLSAGTMRVENVGENYGGSVQAVPVKTGRVYALSGERSDKSAGAGAADCHLGGAGSHDRYVSGGQWANGPFYSLVEEASVNISATVGGNGSGAWKEHDNISLQEVEPGAIDKTDVSLGSTDGQNARLLTNSSGTERDRLWNDGGFWARTITLGGVDTTVTSTVPWVAEAHTIYVETTQTDSDGFIAYWLDDVFIKELSYQGILPLIDSIPLGSVAGVKTIREIRGK